MLYSRQDSSDLHKVFSNILMDYFLARLLILIKKGRLLQLKFGVGVGVNIYLWAR